MGSEEDYEPNEKYCFWILTKVSRSFALVIQELDPEMRKAICIFYLVLRGLDTVEDDMAFPREKKLPLLESFHEVIFQRGWHLEGCGENKHERNLMMNFYIVIDQFLSLKKVYQNVIKDITRRMGKGMAEYFSESIDRVETVADWDKYCHFVAGLVGIGLSNLFASSTLEDQKVGDSQELSNSMGLFLQKTNIIRDYHEDMVESRAFWPEEVWGRYATKLEDFMEPENIDKAVFCLNHLITNALNHIPDCITYLSMIRNPSHFSFCAIPQVMAIATLAACYNNPQVFTSNRVKMRLGEMSLVFHQTTRLDDVLFQFDRYLDEIQNKIPNGRLDPTAQDTRTLIAKLRIQTAPAARRVRPRESSGDALPELLAGLIFNSGSSWFLRARGQQPKLEAKL